MSKYRIVSSMYNVTTVRIPKPMKDGLQVCTGSKSAMYLMGFFFSIRIPFMLCIAVSSHAVRPYVMCDSTRYCFRCWCSTNMSHFPTTYIPEVTFLYRWLMWSVHVTLLSKIMPRNFQVVFIVLLGHSPTKGLVLHSYWS